MAERSTHNNYTFEDIQRYLQGKMSAAEMHEIEKAALQDPFLADAIEGYHEASPIIAQQHLNEINAALQTEQQESKVVSINKKFQWLRVAAVIIILAGVGVIGTHVFKSSNKQQQVAQVKKEENNKTITQDTVAAIEPETSSVNKNVIVQNKIQRKILSVKKESQSNVYADTIAKDETVTSSVMAAPSMEDSEASKSFASAPLSNQKNNDSLQKFLQGRVSGVNVAKTFAGKITDQDNNPVPFATIQLNNKKQAVAADAEGDFNIKNSDSVLPVTISAAGYKSITSLIKSKTNNAITLDKDDATLSETVVVPLGNKKNKQSEQAAMPVGGWQNFNNYVTNRLNEDSTGNKNYMSEKDIVEMEFLIDEEGNPYNIKITKPLDDNKNLKAIDILKSGPKWTNTLRHKKAKVAIAF